MQEENSIIQSPCFCELANKLVAHLVLIRYEMGDKLVALVQARRQTCRPSRAELGLKDWADEKYKTI
jgi:hypothetical protein